MSKRMVDLKVKDGKVASINGCDVGGTAVEANPQEEATAWKDYINPSLVKGFYMEKYFFEKYCIREIIIV